MFRTLGPCSSFQSMVLLFLASIRSIIRSYRSDYLVFPPELLMQDSATLHAFHEVFINNLEGFPLILHGIFF